MFTFNFTNCRRGVLKVTLNTGSIGCEFCQLLIEIYNPEVIATLLCCDDIMLHFRKHPVTSLLTMTEYLPALIINGPMRVSIMVLLVGVMPGREGTRQPEDGQCTLGIIPLTWMTL